MMGLTLKRRFIGNKSRLNRWARGIGKMTGKTEVTIRDAKADIGTKFQRLRTRQQRILRKLAVHHQASLRALKKVRLGIRRTSAEMNGAFHRAVRLLRPRNARKSVRVTARKLISGWI